jgi:hypothetical protein
MIHDAIESKCNVIVRDVRDFLYRCRSERPFAMTILFVTHMACLPQPQLKSVAGEAPGVHAGARGHVY